MTPAPAASKIPVGASQEICSDYVQFCTGISDFCKGRCGRNTEE